MVMLLVLLALVPLLSLVPLHWYAATGARSCLPKAICLSFSGSVFWGLFSACIVLWQPGWGWVPYPLLGLGAALCGASEWLYCDKHRRILKTGSVLACFCMVFLLASWLLPRSAWDDLCAQRQAVSSLSRFHGISR